MSKALLAGAIGKVTSFWSQAQCLDHAGLHNDRVFLGGGGSERLLTIWVPFQAVTPQSGSMLVCSRSHRSGITSPKS